MVDVVLTNNVISDLVTYGGTRPVSPGDTGTVDVRDEGCIHRP